MNYLNIYILLFRHLVIVTSVLMNALLKCISTVIHG